MHSKPKQNARRRVKVAKYAGIYRSISGNYEIAFRDSDGKLRFRTIGPNLQEAVAARAEVVGKVTRGEVVRPSKVTFADFAEEWLSGLDKRPRTIDAYRYALDRHLLPRFGRRKLSDVTTDDVAQLVSAMSRAGYAAWTISGSLSTLSGMMRRAERKGMIARNPVSGLERDERPKVSGGEKRVLDEAEIRRLLEAARPSRTLLALFIFSGLRLSEALGLRWTDLDFEGRFIRVRGQLNSCRGLDSMPKTDSGRRDIVLVPQLEKLLKAHRLASPFSADADFVFPAPDGRGQDRRAVARKIERAVKRAELGEGISAHAFRHTFASLLIVGLKLDPVNVAAQLGHSNPNVTVGTYSHLFDKARAADSMRTALGDGFGHLLAASS